MSARLEQPGGHRGEVGGLQVPPCSGETAPSSPGCAQRDVTPPSARWWILLAPGRGYPRGEQSPPKQPPGLCPAVPTARIHGGQPGAAPLPAPAQPARCPEGLVLLQSSPRAWPAPAPLGNPLPGRLPGSQLRCQPAGLPGEPGPAQPWGLEKAPDIWRAIWRVFEPPQFGMDGVDEAAHGGMGMENIHSLVLGCGPEWGDMGDITTLEKPGRAGDGSWVHQGAAKGAAGPQLRAVVPLSCPWCHFSWTTSPPSPTPSSSSARRSCGCCPCGTWLSSTTATPRTSLVSQSDQFASAESGATQTEPAGSVPTQEPSQWGQGDAGGGTGLPPAPQSCWFSLSSVFGAVLCPRLHFLLE